LHLLGQAMATPSAPVIEKPGLRPFATLHPAQIVLGAIYRELSVPPCWRRECLHVKTGKCQQRLQRVTSGASSWVAASRKPETTGSGLLYPRLRCRSRIHSNPQISSPAKTYKPSYLIFAFARMILSCTLQGITVNRNISLGNGCALGAVLW